MIGQTFQNIARHAVQMMEPTAYRNSRHACVIVRLREPLSKSYDPRPQAMDRLLNPSSTQEVLEWQ